MNKPVNARIAPFARILPVIILGILASNAVKIPLWSVIVLFSVSFVIAALFHRKEWSTWPVAAAMFFLSMGITYLTLTKEVVPKGEKVVAALHITDSPRSSGRWIKATGVLDKYRLASDGDTQWKKSGEKIIVRFDTSHTVSAGDRIITELRLSPVADSTYAEYLRLMERRGYSASGWVYSNYKTVILPDKAKTPTYFASRMQASAGERMDRLELDPGAMAVSKAMSIGVKQNLSPELLESYSLTGASHLLAVSGLHVGIVAMLINLLLSPLGSLRRGHLAKNIVAVGIIWLYAMMTGLSPSVVRAPMMFTGLQFAMLSSRPGGGMNGLLGTAAVMLLINPNYLYDISFQLSFVAVLGIFVLYRPLFGLVKTGWGWVNAIWSVILIGVAATVFTAPLVSYYFGRMPVIGVFLNPVVILTANVIVLFSLLWIITPLPFLNGFFSFILNAAGGLQNDVVAFSSNKSWASVPISLTLPQVIFVYIVGALIIYIAKTQLAAGRKSVIKE